MGKAHRGRATVIVIALGLILPLAACSDKPEDAPSTMDMPQITTQLTSMATAMSTLNLSSAPVASPAAANEELTSMLTYMGSYTPAVTAGDITYSPETSSAKGILHYTWSFPSGDWTYDSTVSFVYADSTWSALWSPSVLHPVLTTATGLAHSRLAPERAGMLAADGTAIVEKYNVVNVGIDKTKITADQVDSSSRQLAAIVGVNPDTYATRVAAAGPKAFVSAVTFRQYDVPAQVADVPGAYGQPSTAMLGPTSTFGQPIIGAMREATADDIANSDGSIVQGDQVGATGLQAAFDSILRGTPGDIVFVTPREAKAKVSTLATSDILFTADAVNGTPIHLSFDMDMQEKAEQVLASYGATAAAVIIRPSTGAVLAAANTPGWTEIPDATAGAYAPGSTFKVAVALALLRHGYTPDTIVNCPASVKVGSQSFKNVAGYPPNMMGNITLAQALANSCNTAFINQYKAVSSADIIEAAGSLGFGIKYSTGAGFNFGTAPTATSDAMKAMTMIGQGGVLANPLAMATVAASVAAGHTVIPWAVQEKQPTSTAKPLTSEEAQQLRTMMGLTVSAGGATNMRGWVAGAKTGTAQWGPSDDVKTHAWMIAFTDSDLAIAVWVKEGAGGARVAGPIIQQLLS